MKKENNILFCLAFAFVMFFIGVATIQGSNSIEYNLESVEVDCLFNSEQEVLSKLSFVNTETEDFNSIIKSNDIYLDNVELLTTNSLKDIKIEEWNEEFVVYNRLSYRSVDDSVGSAFETVDDKYYRIFGAEGVNKRGRCVYYSGGESEAEADMTFIKVQVWDINENNEWFKQWFTLQVNKRIATTIQCIFAELLELPEEERIPIYSIGSYRYNVGTSCHSCGVALDINWKENAEMTIDRVVTTGSYWKPYEDKYSIPADSKLVEIFYKYGFGWGGTWDSKKDYMHFSYFNR